MAQLCPRCGKPNPAVARFCRHCGLRMEWGARGICGAGALPHGDPLEPPDAYVPVAGAAHLYFHHQAAGGGGARLLGTEPVLLSLFNGGYDLVEVRLRIVGLDATGAARFEVARELESWRRGQTVESEIPSYELPEPVRALRVELANAEFGPAE